MAPHEPSREELLDENERLRAEVERLQAMLQQQGQKRKTEEDSVLEEERARKKPKTQREESQLVPLEHNAGMPGVERGSHHQQALEDQQQVVVFVPRVNIIQILPAELLGRVLDFLRFSERRAFFMCGSRELWNRVRVEYETKRMCDLILDYTPTHSFLCRDYSSVCRLNFGSHGSDAALALLCHERAFPQLKHLAMVRSASVTDKGLALIPLNPIRCRNLVTIDITFCPRTTIEAIFLLQDRLINLRLVRRQPPWMDGETLFMHGTRVVFWADGSTAFYGINGEMTYCTYFRNLFEEGSRHRVVSKTQVVSAPFLESESFQSEPEWLRHALRIGVSFMYLADTHSVIRTAPASNTGTFPLQGFPNPEDAQLIPMNSQCFFDQEWEQCEMNHPDKYAQVWHLQLQPLDALIPPHDVVNRIRDQVEREKVVMARRDQENDEREAHFRGGGNRNDVPPEYWFQY